MIKIHNLVPFSRTLDIRSVVHQLEESFFLSCYIQLMTVQLLLKNLIYKVGIKVNVSEVQKGEYNEASIDTIYWRKIFKTFREDLNLKFKAVGSKQL